MTDTKLEQQVYRPLENEETAYFKESKKISISKNFDFQDPSQRNTKIEEEKPICNSNHFRQKHNSFNYTQKNLSKAQFVNNISKVLGNFFNPLINALSNKERSVCKKLGLSIEVQDHLSRNKNRQEIQEQAKVQSVNQSNKKKSNQKIVSKNTFQQNQGNKKNNTSKQSQNEPKSNKRRIIRKIVRKPAFVRRDHEEKKLVKQMEQNFDCKLRNNRLYIKGMPKKPVSSFFFFFKQYSKKIQQENQQLQTSKQLTYGSALAKRISKRWRQMTEQQKAPYKLLSQTTRQAYQKRMNEFKSQNKEVFDSFKKIKRIKANETRRIKIQRESKQNQFQQIQVESEQQNDNKNNESKIFGKKTNQIQLQSEEQLPIVVAQDDEEKSKTKKPIQRNLRQRFKSIHKPKSPSPSFFFFYNEKKVQISTQHNVTRGAKITQIASEMWKKMSEQEKHPYEHLANQRRKQYYEEMKRFEVDHPQEWAKMIAHRRRVTGNEFLKKNSESKARELEKINDNEEENSQSIEEQSQEIDSLEGTVIQKSNKNDQSESIKQQQKVSLSIVKQQEKQNQSVKSNQDKQPQSRRKRAPRKNPIQKPQNNDQNQGKQQEKQSTTNAHHRPKAPISSFFMFYRENNSVLAQQFQQKNGGKLVQYASQIWKNMTESDKKPYEIQAQESRQKYYKEMQIYKQKYPEQIKQRRIDLKKKHESQANGEKKRKTVKKQPSIEEVKQQSHD